MSKLTSIEKMRNFIADCPFISDFTNNIKVDWSDINSFGLMPMGQSTISREEDTLGNVIYHKQYNFSLFAENYTIEDVMRIETVGFLDRFSEWIESESAKGNAPIFGDYPDEEYITAQNGMLYQLYEDGQSGRYQLQIQVKFDKNM